MSSQNNDFQDFNLEVLIVEDSISFTIELEMMVKEIGYKVIGKADNAGTAFEKIYSLEPDLILMDIDIKGEMTGIDVANKIKYLGIPVLFITSFGQDSYYEMAQEANLIGYLVKPVEKYALRSAIEQAFKKRVTSNNLNTGTIFSLDKILFFKKKNILHKIEIEDILYVKASDNYSITTTTKGNFISTLRISELYKLLEPYHFFKVHRSYIVNLAKVETMDIGNGVLSIEQQEIPISRNNRMILLDKINMVK